MLDILGIGFGPSNLALAIQMHELNVFENKKVKFIEKKNSFVWQPGLLLPNTNLQIHFLKDLVTLINPCSKFTFINYLNENGRLLDFINLNISCPSRFEFNDYLTWAASQFSEFVIYNSYIKNIIPVVLSGEIQYFNVSYIIDNEEFNLDAKNIILASGRSPKKPDIFSHEYDGISIIHSDKFTSTDLFEKTKQEKDGFSKVAIVGAGQSAAEIFNHLIENMGSNVKLYNFIRGYGYNPSDSSPFRNQVFNPEFVDVFFQLEKNYQKEILNKLSNTNYSVVDSDLIEEIYTKLYHMRHIEKSDKATILSMTEIEKVERTFDNKINLTYKDKLTGISNIETLDYIILATGYDQVFIKNKYFIEFNELLDQKNNGEIQLNRDYSVKFKVPSTSKIFLQGYSESTHGLSDSLISVIANRANIIAKSLMLKEVINK
ncbi:SidA/IucD/PvdA family monooxygenase [Leptospira sp. 201903075]|uniref:SidA/IucD/PvdA family monooxygenase n=1 Tax=Leptospira chreensis TaxID=2810035 RepID=UPI001964A795|nr:SidA/IucD/PvdA family monooxygenase [Leptospira chreensis]MBM9591690.1 SidA/IucD/PvdA family monooxygenase [Leptospira chreensis]